MIDPKSPQGARPILSDLTALACAPRADRSTSPLDVARAVLDACVPALSIPADRVDVCLFSSSSFWGDGDPERPRVNLLLDNYFNTHAVQRLLWETGLVRAVPMGLFFAGAASTGAALSVANALVSSGDAAAVLAVVSDVQAEGVARDDDPLFDHVGDGAGAFLVSRSGHAGAAIVACEYMTAASLAGLSRADRRSDPLAEWLEGLACVWRNATREAPPEAIILPAHRGPVATRIQSALARTDEQPVLRGEGSFFPGAMLSNARRWLSCAGPARVALVSTGRAAWGATVLERALEPGTVRRDADEPSPW